MSDDEDWFERALREETGDESDDAGGGPDDESLESGEDDGAGTDAGEPGAGPVEFGAEPEDEDEDDAGEFGAGAGATGGDEDDAPFGQDFASAFENAPDPGTGGGSGGGEFGGPDGTGGEFGGLGAESGGAGAGGEFGGFGEASGAEGEGGFGGFGGGESFDADEADFESDIERVEIGIEGLDEMILGGIPQRSLMTVVGSAGTGKTTFGLQFLRRTLSEGGRGVYITLEESRERILDTADEKGWGFSEYAAEERLAVVDFDPIEMANSLASISSELPQLVESFGADRLVLDSVSLLEMMYDHPSRRRSEVFQFSRALKEAGVTTMVTSEASEDTAYASRYGIIEYLADAVFVLQYVRPSDFRETRLAVEIQKIRDANHSRETKPYEITNEGISVHRQANIF
ncbi:MAG: KaiC domain-containing protein [Haloferacaceae archaeon]